MELSESGFRLRQLIEKVIKDHIITHKEYESIIQLATEDGHIDPHEKVLLSTLQDMIESKMVRWSKE